MYSPNNWHMQAYFGIRMYDDKDELIVDEDFGTAETTELANLNAKWEVQTIATGFEVVGLYGQIWQDGVVRRLGLITVKKE